MPVTRPLSRINTMSALPFDKLDVDDVILKLTTEEKVTLLSGLDMVCTVKTCRIIEL